jgi:hypothetical protein
MVQVDIRSARLEGYKGALKATPAMPETFSRLRLPRVVKQPLVRKSNHADERKVMA